MNATRYGDYSRDVSGWFLGMTGAQLALVTLAGVPALLALNAQTWGLLLVWLPVWTLLAAVLLVPIRGRAAGRAAVSAHHEPRRQDHLLRRAAGLGHPAQQEAPGLLAHAARQG